MNPEAGRFARITFVMVFENGGRELAANAASPELRRRRGGKGPPAPESSTPDRTAKNHRPGAIVLT
jgi:hypothetical protein